MTRRPLRILFVTPEAVPYFKTGGLADVSRSLPDALARRGHDVRVLHPLYRPVRRAGRPLASAGGGRIDWPGGPISYRLREDRPVGGAPALLVDARRFFDVGRPYLPTRHDPVAEAVRFAFFCRVAVHVARDWGADIVHLNDWQTGLVPAYGLLHGLEAVTVFGIHNLAYQGNFPPSLLSRVGLPDWLHRTENGLEFHGSASFLKAGLALSDRLVTVSPSYAREIQTPELGSGMHGLLWGRRRSLVGILNGIDTASWDPAADSALSAPYDANRLQAKETNRRELLHELGLDARAPLVVMVTRLAHQKGIDLLVQALPQLARRSFRVAVLGDGDPSYEEALARAVTRHPRRFAAYFRFDEALARRLYAGGDFFLMPSLFEPCGLGQMIAQRYGTPPVVRRTGGLADTVSDGRTGFVFDEADHRALVGALERARSLWRTPGLVAMRRRCMALDRSWTRSAALYGSLYRSALDPLASHSA